MIPLSKSFSASSKVCKKEVSGSIISAILATLPD
jgi:hypothetical protein